MSSRHLSLRLGAETFERLDTESRRMGQPRSQVARLLIEEGLRMHAHPGIVCRSGPAGRRPGLVGGPDDWIARVDDEARRAEATWRREQDLLRA